MLLSQFPSGLQLHISPTYYDDSEAPLWEVPARAVWVG
jgi:hypothetical protein